MGKLFEKTFTIALRLRAQVDDDELKTRPHFVDEQDDCWKEASGEQYRLLQALLASGESELLSVFLEKASYLLKDLSENDWLRALLGKTWDDDPSFFAGGMLLSTIKLMEPADRTMWLERREMEDEYMGNLFLLCTEDFDRCFQVKIDGVQVGELM